MKTIRRNKLLNLAKAGRLVAVGSYHFDDMMGQSISKNEIPVRIKDSFDDHKDGFCNLREFDFTCKGGRAWDNGNGTVTLYIHSNSNFDLRIIEAA